VYLESPNYMSRATRLQSPLDTAPVRTLEHGQGLARGVAKSGKASPIRRVIGRHGACLATGSSRLTTRQRPVLPGPGTFLMLLLLSPPAPSRHTGPGVAASCLGGEEGRGQGITQVGGTVPGSPEYRGRQVGKVGTST